jgi:hypothetical protein
MSVKSLQGDFRVHERYRQIETGKPCVPTLDDLNLGDASAKLTLFSTQPLDLAKAWKPRLLVRPNIKRNSLRKIDGDVPLPRGKSRRIGDCDAASRFGDAIRMLYEIGSRTSKVYFGGWPTQLSWNFDLTKCHEERIPLT